jgi:hypothetical protein
MTMLSALKATVASMVCSFARECCVVTPFTDQVHLTLAIIPVLAHYIAGDVTLGDILEILPFEDPLVVLECDGQALWEALEASLSTWPAQEGSAMQYQ